MTYTPYKVWNKRLTANNKDYKSLRNLYNPEKYLLKHEKDFTFNNIRTSKPSSEARDYLNNIYNKVFSKYFGNNTNLPKIIIRTYEATMHRDPSWSTNLFLTIVLHAPPAGHILYGSNYDIKEKDMMGSNFIILRQGDVFILDPLSIHSVHTRARTKQELILAQYELPYKSREEALETMNNSKWTGAIF